MRKPDLIDAHELIVFSIDEDEETGKSFDFVPKELIDAAPRINPEKIARQCLIEHFQKWKTSRRNGKQKFINGFFIVRCEECIHHEDEEPGMVYCPNIVGGWVDNNFYCADGNRGE